MVMATCALLLLGFLWKVFVFYRDIKSGTLVPADFTYAKSKAGNASLNAIAASAPGSGELATSDDPILGSPDAKVVIVEFGDFGCPYSQEEAQIVRALQKTFSGEVAVIYRDFPLEELHPGATIAAKVGECAGEQGKFWEFHDAIFRTTPPFSEDQVVNVAKSVGVSEGLLRTCLKKSYYDQEVSQDQVDGVNAGVVGTPTFFINGVKIEGNIPYEDFKNVITTFIAQP